MKNLEKYKVLLWDFDGVIMDSMPVREIGFRKVLKNFPKNQVDTLIAYHRKNGGWSRYVKFRYFYEEILNSSISEEEVIQLADKFSVIMKELLLSEELLISDSLEYIKENHHQVPMHVVSGSDGEELRYLCQQLGLSNYFLSINGSPTPKGTLIKDLLLSQKYSREDVVMIGDAHNDKDAAFENDIDFAGYNNEALRSPGYLYIDSFSKLVESF